MSDPYRINLLRAVSNLLELSLHSAISDVAFRLSVDQLKVFKSRCDTNPAPVIIGLIFTELHDTGGKILLVQRAIPPSVGGWALVSGFVIDTINWRGNLRKEAMEEASVQLSGKPEDIVPFWFASNEPRTNLLLNFAVVLPKGVEAILPFNPDHETLDRKEFAFTRECRPDFCFPIHGEVFDLFCREHFGW